MHVEKRPGPSRTGAWVIISPNAGGERSVVGKIIVAYPQDGAGRLYACLWDWARPDRASRTVETLTSGFGFDKAGAAIGKALLAGGFGKLEHPKACPHELAEERLAWQKLEDAEMGAGLECVAEALALVGYHLFRVL
jgi:hypothetical protein